jgi:hypothetical protein
MKNNSPGSGSLHQLLNRRARTCSRTALYFFFDRVKILGVLPTNWRQIKSRRRQNQDVRTFLLDPEGNPCLPTPLLNRGGAAPPLNRGSAAPPWTRRCTPPFEPVLTTSSSALSCTTGSRFSPSNSWTEQPRSALIALHMTLQYGMHGNFLHFLLCDPPWLCRSQRNTTRRR